MRIAFFTPLSPIRSALADFAEGLALAIANQPDISIDIFINDNYKPDNQIIINTLNVFSHRQFSARAKDYDVYLYSMGDHGRFHGYMLPYIYQYPGIVILNDLTLHRCIIQSTLLNGDKKAYLAELEYAYGIKDMHLANQIQAGLGQHLIMDFPLFERVVDNSLGVVVQNKYAQSRILAKRPEAKTSCIPYPFFMPPGFIEGRVTEKQAQKRTQLGLQDQFVIGSFGLFVADKHLEDCLNAFANLVHKHPQTTYILGGDIAPGYDLIGYIKRMGLEKHVIITGWSSPAQFVEYMFALDVGIHLRYPHIGGTPYTPIRLMGLGISTIVSDIEPLAEIPQGACIKIVPDLYQQQTLTDMLHFLVDQPNTHHKIGLNGQQFIERYHNIGDNARQYCEFLTSFL